MAYVVMACIFMGDKVCRKRREWITVAMATLLLYGIVLFVLQTAPFCDGEACAVGELDSGASEPLKRTAQEAALLKLVEESLLERQRLLARISDLERRPPSAAAGDDEMTFGEAKLHLIKMAKELGLGSRRGSGAGGGGSGGGSNGGGGGTSGSVGIDRRRQWRW